MRLHCQGTVFARQCRANRWLGRASIRSRESFFSRSAIENPNPVKRPGTRCFDPLNTKSTSKLRTLNSQKAMDAFSKEILGQLDHWSAAVLLERAAPERELTESGNDTASETLKEFQRTARCSPFAAATARPSCLRTSPIFSASSMAAQRGNWWHDSRSGGDWARRGAWPLGGKRPIAAIESRRCGALPKEHVASDAGGRQQDRCRRGQKYPAKTDRPLSLGTGPDYFLAMPRM
jgi:hypothetical protein